MTFLIVGWFLVKLLRKNVEMQEKIEFMAYYDSLTTLPNRAALLEKLGEMMQALTKNPKYSIALFFIDVDNFKKVNDSEGHITGDILLQDIAKFLKSHSNLRPLVNNKEFVARLGGDEFVMLYPIKSTEEIHKFAQLLIDDFKKLKANNHVMTDFKVSLSIGAATYPQDAHDTSSLLKAADQAMYEVKRGGKQNYSIYGEDKEK